MEVTARTQKGARRQNHSCRWAPVAPVAWVTAEAVLCQRTVCQRREGSVKFAGLDADRAVRRLRWVFGRARTRVLLSRRTPAHCATVGLDHGARSGLARVRSRRASVLPHEWSYPVARVHGRRGVARCAVRLRRQVAPDARVARVWTSIAARRCGAVADLRAALVVARATCAEGSSGRTGRASACIDTGSCDPGRARRAARTRVTARASRRAISRVYIVLFADRPAADEDAEEDTDREPEKNTAVIAHGSPPC